MERNFHDMIGRQWRAGHFVCVGLDIEYDRIPEHLKEGRRRWEAMFDFGKQIVDATRDLVCAYKPQSAHYEAEGPDGERVLYELVRYIHEKDSRVPIILDAKRGDIKSTNAQYVASIFDHYDFDAVTLQPYLGGEPLEPFLERKEKGCIILCRTSNPGAGEIQDLVVNDMPLWQKVALLVKEQWNKNGNCLLVVGATYPEEMKEIRKIVGDIPFLIPGVGAQGGNDVATVVQVGMDSRRQGMIINSSRGILYASSGTDFAEKARRATEELHNAIINAMR